MQTGRTRRRAGVVLLAAILAAGCATLRFEIDPAAGGTSKAKSRRSVWLFDVASERVEDVRRHCPNGAVQITEATTALDAVSTLLTLGLWWPRTTFYDCRGPAPATVG